MVSYGEFHQMPARLQAAQKLGLRKYLDVPKAVRIYLDNGAFYFLRQNGMATWKDYEQFVKHAKPDWWPIPFDAIPTPQMTARQQRRCFDRTMDVNRAYEADGFVPVIHVCRLLKEYIDALKANARLARKRSLALGGLVPNLLRSPDALPFATILDGLKEVRQVFAGKELHVFGIGGTATLHLAALLKIDSVDSSGWRNRAARGIVQLSGRGDRMVANFGSWRGRIPSDEEWKILERCRCPACKRSGRIGLQAGGLQGFAHRACHNLWVLLEEAIWIEKHMDAGTYKHNYRRRLDNSTYLRLVREVLATLKSDERSHTATSG